MLGKVSTPGNNEIKQSRKNSNLK